ncbi:MAG: class I SAM-dependent methyltransferase [Elusimicrobia bacterium]|nr:class I SAM-dependent methyltransferase [Elusimicrobiota bacterium]
MSEAAYFNTRFTVDDKRNKMWQVIAAYLQRYIDMDAKVVDIGAGYCSFINNIECKEKYAVDAFPDFVTWAKTGVKAHVAASYDMPFLESGYFDVVFSSNLLEHLTYEELGGTFKEIKRILKKNGKVILIGPNYKYCYRDYYDDYTHKTPLSHVGVSDWLRSLNFEIERCSPRFLPFSFKTILPKMKILVWLYLRFPIKVMGKQMLVIARKTGG